MGRRRQGFEASGALRTFYAAEKVTAAAARYAAAAAHPAPNAKAALSRTHGMEAAEEERPPEDANQEWSLSHNLI